MTAPESPMRVRFALSLLASSFLLLGASASVAPVRPDCFVAEPIGSGWERPVGLCFLDQQRLLVDERDGRVWFVENDQRRNLVYDIHAETLINGDRGLLGMAAHPGFDEQGGWLYLLLVVDNQGGGDTAQQIGRAH